MSIPHSTSSWVSNLVVRVFGTEPEFDLSQQAFHQSCNLSGLALFSGVFLAFRTGNWLLIGVLIVCMCVLTGAYWLSRFKRKFGVALVLFAVVGYTTIVSNYFLTAGVNGYTAVVAILALSLLYASSSSKYHWLWTVFHSVVFGILLLFEYQSDALWITPIPSEEARYLDQYLAYVIVVLFTFFTFRLIRKSYEKQSQKIKEQRNELQKVKVDLEESNKELMKLISVLAHDVRNPLASVQAFLELTNGGFKLAEDKRLDMSNRMHEMIKGTTNMMDDLVNYSRSKMTSGSSTFDNKRLGNWLDATISTQQQMAKLKGVDLKVDYNPESQLYCDSLLMTVVVRNLIQNALKFTESSKSVRFSVKENAASFDFVIEDEGVGMSKADLDQLFTRNFVSKPGVRKEKGTGLGLLLVKEYVDKHQGKINVSSQLGEGTTFVVSIPNIEANSFPELA